MLPKRGVPPIAFRHFCVLCAKPEELAAVITVFDERFETDPTASESWGDHVYVTSGDQKRKLMVTTCAGMGHVNAAIRTAQILARHGPEVFAFVGTAASLDPAAVQLGDVVIPRKAVIRAYDKISQKGQKDYDARDKPGFQERFLSDNALVADTESVKLTADAQALVAALPLGAIELQSGHGTAVSIDGKEYPLRAPKLHVDLDIFSCGMVVDSISYRDFLIKLGSDHLRKAHVIDMESFGFFEAVKAADLAGNCDAIMIRGISDYAGRKQQTEALQQEQRPTGWKDTASRNAAIVAANLFEALAKRSSRPQAVPPSAGAAA